MFTLLLMSASCYFFPRYALALTCFLSHSLSRLKPLLSLKDFYNNLTSLSLSISLLFQFSPVTQLCWTLCDPIDCSLSGSSTHETLQARTLEWVAISFSIDEQ